MREGQPSLDYFAGFFDGEGNVTIAKAPSRYRGKRSNPAYSLRVQVANVDVTPLTAFRDRFGGFVRPVGRKPNPKWSPTFAWHASADIAAAFLAEIRSLLIVKQHDADIGIAFQQLMKRSVHAGNMRERWRGVPKEDVAARESLRLRLIERHGTASRANCVGITGRPAKEA